jgi:hypothetical protein
VVEILIHLLRMGRDLPKGYVSVDASTKHGSELLITPLGGRLCGISTCHRDNGSCVPSQREKGFKVGLLTLECVNKVPDFECAVFRCCNELAWPSEVHGAHAIHVALEATARLKMNCILRLVESTGAPVQRVLLQFLD